MGVARCLHPAPSLIPSQRKRTQGAVSREHLKIASGQVSYCLLQMWSSQDVCHLILGVEVASRDSQCKGLQVRRP